MIPERILSILENLRNSEIHGISLEPVSLRLRIDFVGVVGKKDVAIELFHIAKISIDKIPEDEAGDFWAGEVVLTELTDGGDRILTELGYTWKNSDGSASGYPGQQMFHLHIEGGAGCIDIVAGSYNVLEAVEPGYGKPYRPRIDAQGNEVLGHDSGEWVRMD